MNSIETEHLTRTFRLDRAARRQSGRELTALNDVTLAVRRGELFGLLGPNGAGKTTLIRILCTLLTPTRGHAFVEGIDVVRDVGRVRPIINMVSGGETCGYGILTARENLRLFTELYGIPWKVARQRVDDMLKVVGLDRFPGVRVNKLSSGWRQRLNFARGFTTDPRVLFLDEPTLGMDVQSAHETRRFIRQWLAENPDRAIMLTTHYMAEADELCDRIAIIDEGHVKACDSPQALKRMIRGEITIDLTLGGLAPLPQQWHSASGVVRLTSRQDPESQTTTVHVLLNNPEAGGEFIRSVAQDGRRMLNLTTIQPTLEDVFLKLTGRSLGQAEASAEEGAR